MNKSTRRSIVGETLAVALFSMWSLRRRAGQIVPVAVALLLLVGASQSIGALRDVSSVLTQQQIARNWRGPYDLLVRPPSAVSQLERSAGWIDPQSALENYDGISPQQVARIQALPHVTQVTPFANVGWQSINVLVPVELPTKGVYRISAAWVGQWTRGNEVVRYVDVTDLSHLTTEVPLAHPIVQYLLARDDTTPVVFSMSVQAVQALVGIPLSQQAALGQVLLGNLPPATAVKLLLHIERLRGDLSMLPACVEHANCWEPQQLHQGTVSYQADGVQLLRFSRTRLLAAGQISIAALGDDIQGPLYRVQLSGHWSLQGVIRSMPGTPLQIIPLSAPEHMPLIPNAVHFIPLEQACAINAVNCYTGLYMRLEGVEHYNQRSLALLQETAAAIVASTGLQVDILDGSSLRTVSISLSPTGSNLTIQSTWRATGIAVQIVQGVNALQQTLLVLCSIVCLLAIGAAGAVVGIGRRKDALLLQQIGWQRHLLLTAFTLDALMLCVPGCLLAIGWIALARWLWPGSLSAVAMEMLISMGVLVYCCAHVSVACSMSEDPQGNRDLQGDRQGRPYYTTEASGAARSWSRWNTSSVYSRGLPWRSPWGAAFICATAVTSAIFLLAIEYMLITSFNEVLIVTVLGKQVRAVLGGPQLLLLLIILLAAFLTVSLCTKLRVEGRRDELFLLSMVGWERRFVLQRILWDSCWPALLSGEVGVLLAIGGTALVATLPPLLTVAGLLLCGPLLGILLVSLATLGPAWQEMKRVFIWK